MVVLQPRSKGTEQQHRVSTSGVYKMQRRTYIHTHIEAYLHTYIHTYIHTSHEFPFASSNSLGSSKIPANPSYTTYLPRAQIQGPNLDFMLGPLELPGSTTLGGAFMRPLQGCHDVGFSGLLGSVGDGLYRLRHSAHLSASPDRAREAGCKRPGTGCSGSQGPA